MFSGKPKPNGKNHITPSVSAGKADPLGETGGPTQSAAIAKLANPPILDDLSWPGLRSVVAFRILAICSRAGRDPLTELGRRFRSVPAARAFIELADVIGRYWPENVAVCRPCSRVLSPDEATLSHMVDHARAGDRAAFCAELSGFVRAERHEALFAATTQAVAHMDMSDWQGCRAPK